MTDDQMAMLRQCSAAIRNTCEQLEHYGQHRDLTPFEGNVLHNFRILAADCTNALRGMPLQDSDNHLAAKMEAIVREDRDRLLASLLAEEE